MALAVPVGPLYQSGVPAATITSVPRFQQPGAKYVCNHRLRPQFRISLSKAITDHTLSLSPTSCSSLALLRMVIGSLLLGPSPSGILANPPPTRWISGLRSWLSSSSRTSSHQLSMPRVSCSYSSSHVGLLAYVSN